jgi:hypothetical protein
MKHTLLIIAFFFCGINLFGQSATETLLQGKVSYTSSQHVYVQFVNTDGIHVGDTLFVSKDNVYLPALVVNNMSSISCACVSLATTPLAISTPIFAHRKVDQAALDVIAQKSQEAIAVNDLAINAPRDKNKGQKARVDGRISVSSYSNKSSYSSYQRFRYNFSLEAKHIDDSKISFESNISFTHKLNETIQLHDALKVYGLDLKYDIDKTSTLTFGRKINSNMANVGAVDGLQYEKKLNNFTVGALVGSRPDSVYGFDPKLLQFGAFASHNIQKENGYMQTSLAFFNQMTKFQTGRRFMYFQHSNSLLKNLDLFCSAEVDLYNAKDSTNKFDLTSAYVSLRYRPLNNLSLSLSYDARKNIYYYETYKSRTDSLLEKETRQGYRFQFNYRPFRKLSWGGTAGYRLQTPTAKASYNGYTYLTYSQVPFIDVAATIFATMNKSNNMDGKDYGISLSRDIIDGKLSAEVEYRHENYNLSNYGNTTTLPNISLVSLIENSAELSLSWRLSKKLMLSADFEYSKDADNKYIQRAFINISHRF